MGRRIRVLRIIARMNVGGPAYHVSLLSGRLSQQSYQTVLIAGHLGPGEASFSTLAERYGADLRVLPALGPELNFRKDMHALWSLIRLMRSFRPDIVHTHTAKAGAIGRLAARLALGRSTIVVHTYHGHVLRDYFGPVKSALFRVVERLLGLVSDSLIAVSAATVQELVELGVAPHHKFTVIPVGLELDRFEAVPDQEGMSVRRELDVTSSDCLALVAGRLVPIKRVDVALRALAIARSRGAPLKLAVAGDGEMRAALERLAHELELEDHVRFLGFRGDLDAICAGADLALLTSDNEGTPVALIEASAAGTPSIATSVGGVSDIVTPETGRLTAAGDVDGIAAALVELASDSDLRQRLGSAARHRVLALYKSDRLVADVERLYAALLRRRDD